MAQLAGMGVDFVEYHPMQGADRLHRDRGCPIGQGKQQVERFRVVRRFEMLTQGLAAHGDPLLDHELGFAQGERIALDRIRVVGEQQAKLVTQVAHYCRIERAEPIEACLLLGNPPCEMPIKGGKVSHRTPYT